MDYNDAPAAIDAHMYRYHIIIIDSFPPNLDNEMVTE